MSELFLLVVQRVEEGASMLRAFGADLSEWRIVYFGAPLMGLRFERAVVILPCEGREEALEFTRAIVPLKLPPNVRPQVFG